MPTPKEIIQAANSIDAEYSADYSEIYQISPAKLNKVTLRLIEQKFKTNIVKLVSDTDAQTDIQVFIKEVREIFYKSMLAYLSSLPEFVIKGLVPKPDGHIVIPDSTIAGFAPYAKHLQSVKATGELAFFVANKHASSLKLTDLDDDSLTKLEQLVTTKSLEQTQEYEKTSKTADLNAYQIAQILAVCKMVREYIEIDKLRIETAEIPTPKPEMLPVTELSQIEEIKESDFDAFKVAEWESTPRPFRFVYWGDPEYKRWTKSLKS